MTRIAPHIYQYPTQAGDRYAVRYYFRNLERWKKGILTKKRAERYLNKTLVRLDDARHFPERIPVQPLKAYAKTWLAHQELRGLAPNTLRSYRMNLRRHVLPTLGELPLDQISRSHIIQLMLQKKTEGLAPNSIRLVVAPLSAALMSAMDEGLIPSNPAVRPSRILPVRRKVREVETFSRTETRKLLATARQRWPHQYALLLLLFRSGIRIGEALALERADLDVRRGLIHVTKNYTNEHLRLWTKGGSGRWAILDRNTVRVLKDHGAAHGERLFFPGEGRDGHLSLRSWRRWVWEPLLKACGLSHRGLHVTRHTYASQQLEDGKSLVWLKEQLGHSSIAVTVDTYGHLVKRRRTA